jgi:hypothetical protein
MADINRYDYQGFNTTLLSTCSGFLDFFDQAKQGCKMLITDIKIEFSYFVLFKKMTIVRRSLAELFAIS